MPLPLSSGRLIQVYPVRPMVTLILEGTLAEAEQLYQSQPDTLGLIQVIRANILGMSWDVWDAPPSPANIQQLLRRWGDIHLSGEHPDYTFAYAWARLVHLIYTLPHQWNPP